VCIRRATLSRPTRLANFAKDSMTSPVIFRRAFRLFHITMNSLSANGPKYFFRASRISAPESGLNRSSGSACGT
jgi:hypothetical protein